MFPLLESYGRRETGIEPVYRALQDLGSERHALTNLPLGLGTITWPPSTQRT